jgi:hypothetical protein
MELLKSIKEHNNKKDEYYLKMKYYKRGERERVSTIGNIL